MQAISSRARQMFFAASLAAFLGCKSHGTEREALAAQQLSATPASPAAPAPAPNATSYPEGSWRRGLRADLDRTMLWISHVLIRYSDVDESVGFNLTQWRSSQGPVQRSKEQALELAERVSALAQQGRPFAELAEQYSEDPETRERAGSLGGISAGHLVLWPQVLDALEALGEGGVSNPVLTPYGYHVLHRRAPVPEQLVSGAHIVIGHADAPWLGIVARGKLPARSREDARALARRVFEQARAEPARFAALVSEYSEHRDAARGGDFGSWSTRETTGYPREIETLSQLEVGAISEPIDTLFGFQIIQRTENRPRERYAMTKLQLRFDLERPDADPASKAGALRKAQELSKALQRDPASFEELQKKLCCTDVMEVVEGRELPALEETLRRLAPGQVGTQPIEDAAVEYLFVKRLGLDVLPGAPSVRFELAAAPR